MDSFRGPCTSHFLPSPLPPLNQLLPIDKDALLVLVTGAHKELAYLNRLAHRGQLTEAFEGILVTARSRICPTTPITSDATSSHYRSCQTMTPSLLSAFVTPTSTSRISRIPTAAYTFVACWTGSMLLCYPSSCTPVCPTTYRTKRTRSLDV